MIFKRKLLAAAAALALSAGAAQAQISGNVVKIGVLNDQSSLYADLSGQGSVLAAKMAIEDFRRGEEGHQDRGGLRRPPEQARRGLADRPQVVRLRGRGRDRRHAELRRGARREPDHQGQEARRSSSPAPPPPT